VTRQTFRPTLQCHHNHPLHQSAAFMSSARAQAVICEYILSAPTWSYKLGGVCLLATACQIHALHAPYPSACHHALSTVFNSFLKDASSGNIRQTETGIRNRIDEHGSMFPYRWVNATSFQRSQCNAARTQVLHLTSNNTVCNPPRCTSVLSNYSDLCRIYIVS